MTTYSGRGPWCLRLLFMLVLVFSVACCARKGESSVPHSSLKQEPLVRVQESRSRLRSIRTGLDSNPLRGADLTFVLDQAVNGDIVNSALAFLVLEQSLADGHVTKEGVLYAYLERFKSVRGMNAILTMRSLERIIVPDAQPANPKRDRLIMVVRKHAGVERFTEEEIQMAEDLANGGEEDTLILVELLLSKHSPSQMTWAMEKAKTRAESSNGQVRELLEFALDVMEKR